MIELKIYESFNSKFTTYKNLEEKFSTMKMNFEKKERVNDYDPQKFMKNPKIEENFENRKHSVVDYRKSVHARSKSQIKLPSNQLNYQANFHQVSNLDETPNKKSNRIPENDQFFFDDDGAIDSFNKIDNNFSNINNNKNNKIVNNKDNHSGNNDWKMKIPVDDRINKNNNKVSINKNNEINNFTEIFGNNNQSRNNVINNNINNNNSRNNYNINNQHINNNQIFDNAGFDFNNFNNDTSKLNLNNLTQNNNNLNNFPQGNNNNFYMGNNFNNNMNNFNYPNQNSFNPGPEPGFSDIDLLTNNNFNPGFQNPNRNQQINLNNPKGKNNKLN